LRNSLGCESIPPHFHRVGSSSNHFPNSLSLFLPLRRRSATCTNFPQQPTQLDARRATPSRLGAKAPRVTNAKHMISAKLECSRFGVLFSALKLSLYQTQLKDVTRITQSHREIGESWTRLPSFLRTTSKQQKNVWNSSPPRRGIKGIKLDPKKLAVM
jgi:hypothetical protein